MEPIVSRRHPINFYLMLILTGLFTTALATDLLTQFFNKESHEKVNRDMLPFISLFFYGLTIYSFIRYYKNSPTIRLDDNGISIGKKVFDWKRLQAARLTGKVRFPYLISFEMEGATLFFDSDEIVYLFDDVYQNIGSIKLVIQRKLKQDLGLPEDEPSKLFPISCANTFFETFKNNPWWSFRGLSVWLFALIMVGMFFHNKGPHPFEMASAAVGIFTIWLILHAWMMHYFKVSGTWLVVRNHIWFWKKRTVALSDILEVVFEVHGKQANSMRIIYKNFESHRYQAGTLHTRTWRALKQRLQEEHIFVRDECID